MFEVMARVSKIFTNSLKKLLVNLFIVEFILSAIKVAGLVGFIILGVIIDCGGVGPQGYLGAKYWRTYISLYSNVSRPLRFITLLDHSTMSSWHWMFSDGPPFPTERA